MVSLGNLNTLFIYSFLILFIIASIILIYGASSGRKYFVLFGFIGFINAIFLFYSVSVIKILSENFNLEGFNRFFLGLLLIFSWLPTPLIFFLVRKNCEDNNDLSWWTGGGTFIKSQNTNKPLSYKQMSGRADRKRVHVR